MARLEAIPSPTLRNRTPGRNPVADAFSAETQPPPGQSGYAGPRMVEQAPLPTSADEKWLYDRTRMAA